MCLIICTRQTKKTHGKSVHLPCVFFSTRQRKWTVDGPPLPCDKRPAHGKQNGSNHSKRFQNVCRVPNVWHTAKKKALPCASLCRVFFHKSTVNERFLLGVESLPCVFLGGTRQRSSLLCAISFPCAAVRAHGKDPLYRVPEIQHTAIPKAHGKYAQSRSVLLCNFIL